LTKKKKAFYPAAKRGGEGETRGGAKGLGFALLMWGAEGKGSLSNRKKRYFYLKCQETRERRRGLLGSREGKGKNPPPPPPTKNPPPPPPPKKKKPAAPKKTTNPQPPTKKKTKPPQVRSLEEFLMSGGKGGKKTEIIGGSDPTGGEQGERREKSGHSGLAEKD